MTFIPFLIPERGGAGNVLPKDRSQHSCDLCFFPILAVEQPESHQCALSRLGN